ncbi:MAG: RpiB/LacA/LacB family sugar-phosphate isomerase, partial [Eubacteriales bacterium]
MKIAVINEVSTRAKNKDVLAGLRKLDLEVINVGMSDEPAANDLSYIHTGFMAGAVLNLGLADLVIGGCGTGQGFLISAMQYPNVYCGLIVEPVDAFLFSQINAGNCISLAMNKGYGWAGELNLEYIFEKLFAKTAGLGYPPERAEFQNTSRNLLKGVNQATHKTF